MAKEDVNITNDIEDGDILVLTQEYEFEGEKVKTLDFSGFVDITANDMIEASDILTKAGRVVLNPEMDVQYCLYIAAAATHKPHEFFLVPNMIFSEIKHYHGNEC